MLSHFEHKFCEVEKNVYATEVEKPKLYTVFVYNIMLPTQLVIFVSDFRTFNPTHWPSAKGCALRKSRLFAKMCKLIQTRVLSDLLICGSQLIYARCAKNGMLVANKC